MGRARKDVSLGLTSCAFPPLRASRGNAMPDSGFIARHAFRLNCASQVRANPWEDVIPAPETPSWHCEMTQGGAVWACCLRQLHPHSKTARLPTDGKACLRILCGPDRGGGTGAVGRYLVSYSALGVPRFARRGSGNSFRARISSPKPKSAG
jgi:hypothetical protein